MKKQPECSRRKYFEMLCATNIHSKDRSKARKRKNGKKGKK